MNILAEIRARFRAALAALECDSQPLLEMVVPAQDARFGDYQANCAMPLSKRLGAPPREIAQRIVAGLAIDDLCDQVEIAGPGFINLRLRDDWIAARLLQALPDERLGIAKVSPPKTIVIDYSSPNVAKPMHVGHIRSTVIGDAICRVLRFLGQRVISDNHLGDWGTQFGMIIFGFKHCLDEAAYREHPVEELGRLYKLVNRAVEYFELQEQLPELEARANTRQAAVEAEKRKLEALPAGERKKGEKSLKAAESQLAEARKAAQSAREKIARAQADPPLASLVKQHPTIGADVLRETARLHEGDAENLKLWNEFLPLCRQALRSVYDQLGVQFDYEYGESFYHDRLQGVVDRLRREGLAVDSEGAVCVFLDGFDAPMIVQKRDGAFLYSTSDLATIEFRVDAWRPDSILYVVDHRQSDHFAKLFAAARRLGYQAVDLRHVSFGTVLGADGKPYKTREGEAVALEDLLEGAVEKAYEVVSANDDAAKSGPQLSEERRRHIARTVGLASLKYGDLCHNRTSDYVFSFEKMTAMEGNTATYMQYSYARVMSIFEKGQIDPAEIRANPQPPALSEPAERALALELLRFGDALDETVVDYRPNLLTNYLFELAKRFSDFYQNCPVLDAAGESRRTRLVLCDLTARTLKQGLALLGINVVDKM